MRKILYAVTAALFVLSSANLMGREGIPDCCKAKEECCPNGKCCPKE
jgi:hypothetical protein